MTRRILLEPNPNLSLLYLLGREGVESTSCCLHNIDNRLIVYNKQQPILDRENNSIVVFPLASTYHFSIKNIDQIYTRFSFLEKQPDKQLAFIKKLADDKNITWSWLGSYLQISITEFLTGEKDHE